MLFITLDNICYSNIKTFLSNSEWDIVMATTNLFKIVYKFTRFIKLNKKYSELYYNSSNFRNLIDSKIFNPITQLELNMDNYLITAEETIQDDDIDIEKYALRIHSLSIKYSNINSLSTCKYIKNLDLTGCTYVDDLSPLINIENINLAYCHNITDIKPLKNAHSVNLSHCLKITDISPLKNIKYLKIKSCHNIENFNALENIHTLHLINLNKQIDVSKLYNIKYLTIKFCNIIGYNELIKRKKHNLEIQFKYDAPIIIQL